MATEHPDVAAGGADGALASSDGPKTKRPRREDVARSSASASDDESDPPPLVPGYVTSAETAAKNTEQLQPCDVVITERGVRRVLVHRAAVEAMKEMGFIPEHLFDQLGVPKDKEHRASGI